MLRRLIAIASIFVATSAGAEDYRDTNIPITVDPALDLTQYLGKWYEIARFPNRFEKDCMAVTAEYSARDDGRIDVLNTCRKGAVDGPVKQAKGVARPVSAGKLEVTFVPALSVLGFLWGDYWVLDVTDDYSVAVVGAPEGTTGWILARSPEITQAEYEAAQAVLRTNGYDTDALYRVPQTKD